MKKTGKTLEYEKGTTEYVNNFFPIVRVDTLAITDDFLKYTPKTYEQKEFMDRVFKVIDLHLPNFRAQRIDPSLDEMDAIIYRKGMIPAVGKSPEWWRINAKYFLPKYNSRLGDVNERIAYLALCLKYLIETKGYSKLEAWYTICNQSKDIANYKDSEHKDALWNSFEVTGSRAFGEWFDLGNTWKITCNTDSSFSLVGGNCFFKGDFFPISYVEYILDKKEKIYDGTGWIVLSVTPFQ